MLIRFSYVVFVLLSIMSICFLIPVYTHIHTHTHTSNMVYVLHFSELNNDSTILMSFCLAILAMLSRQ